MLAGNSSLFLEMLPVALVAAALVVIVAAAVVVIVLLLLRFWMLWLPVRMFPKSANCKSSNRTIATNEKLQISHQQIRTKIELQPKNRLCR